ncbi:hypothetical protein HWV62_28324, partial [Athelia sp. TMB]
MQSRIKELESALGSQASDENVRSSLQQGSASLDHAGLYTFEPQENDDIDEVADAVDALSIGAGGQARYHGLTTSSETLQGLIEPPNEHSNLDESDPENLDLTPEIIELFNAFPMGLAHCAYTQTSLDDFLPSREHAVAL